MAKIAELFGTKVSDPVAAVPHDSVVQRHCPFTNRVCDVTANRGDRARFDLTGQNVGPADRALISKLYGSAEIPLGICSIATQRRFETHAKPWIICPKRLMELRATPPIILPEVRALIDIKPGTDVRCWWEFKFASSDDGEDNEVAGRFFEFTFDYILMPVEWQKGNKHPVIVGPPYILEIMTSSTRGGGLTEHMADVLALRDQRSLRGHVKSPYTPNYRQVFGRMASQLFAKSEIAEAWGGKTIWIMQDVLLEYIVQTTAFRPEPFKNNTEGNVNVVVYKMHEHDHEYELKFDTLLRGRSRSIDLQKPDFTATLGLGYAPPLKLLISTLQRTQARVRADGKAPNWIDFKW